MRSTLRITLALGSMLAATANAQPITGAATGVPSAPIGHLQPRSQPLPPGSAAEQAEQRQMSNFDAEQQKLDEELDKHLNICRGC